jgi:hypothetical protein
MTAPSPFEYAARQFEAKAPSPYLNDPVGWARDKQGVHLWSKQREIGESVVANRRTAVKSCHDVGKSFVAGTLAQWWVDVHPAGEAFVASCFTDDTEVLTRDGWKLFQDVKVGPDGDLFATRNPETKRFEWQSAFQFHEAPWDGEVVDVKARSLNLRVTPNHRMLVQWTEWKHGERRASETFKRADAITQRGAELPAMSAWQGASPGSVRFGRYEWDSITFASFLGAWLAEGSLGPARKYERKSSRQSPIGANAPSGPINITQLPATKGYEPYRELLTRMLGREPARSGEHWLFSCSDLWHYLSPLGKAATKYIPAEVKNWGRPELEAFLHFYLLGDGWSTTSSGGRTAWRACTVSKRLADDLQEIAQKAGMWATIKVRPPRNARIEGRKILAENCLPAYYLLFNSSRCRTVSVSRSHYTGNVYCVSVPNETIYVRREGSPIWCGNTAPTYPQVHAILWEEIRAGIKRAAAAGNPLPGRVLQSDEWKLDDGRLVGYGRKPADKDEHGFQGIHRRFVLVILDEACGVPEQLWTASEAITTNADCRILAIGNPDDPSTEFGKVCKPGSGWNVVRVSAFDSPNFTDEPVPDQIRPLLIAPEWVEDKKRRWGETSPRYVAKVLGDFPEIGDDTLISPKWIEAAQQRSLDPGSHTVLGVDVARFGADRTILSLVQGPVMRIIGDHAKLRTTETTGKVVAAKREHHVDEIHVDGVGVGSGVVDELLELGHDVVDMQSGAAAVDREHFANARAEWWWALRQRFEDGDADIDPADDELAAQLGAMKFKFTARGQVLIESKDDMRKRGLPSPDRGDALMLGVAKAPLAEEIFDADEIDNDLAEYSISPY